MVLPNSLHIWDLGEQTILFGFFFTYLSIKTVSSFCIVFIVHSLNSCIIFRYMDVGYKLILLFPYKSKYSKHHSQCLPSHSNSTWLQSHAGF